MKLNFKKIASILAGTVMLSSTLAFAAAANTYPTPFVKNGSADVAVVYGSQPGAEFDLLAVADITQSLQAKLAAQTATGGSSTSGTTVSGGDYVKLARSSDNVNLRDSVTSVWGSTVSKDDLKVLLADGSYKNKKNSEYKYDQKITLGGSLNLEFFADSDYQNQQPTLGVNMSSSQAVLNYTLAFQTQPTSTVTSGDLVDLETTTLNILGKPYYILDFKNSSTGNAVGVNNDKITFLDSANTAIAKEGESTKVTVNGKSFDVKIVYIDSTKVKLDVNGETSDALVQGDTFKLSDGTYIGIREVLARDLAGSIGQTEFSIGSGKLEVQSGKAIKLNDKSYSDITGWINKGATSSDSKENIDKIILSWNTNDKTFITPDKELVMPGFGVLKLSMAKFFAPAQETTTVSNDGSNVIQLKTTIKSGDVTVPLLFANGSGAFLGLGRGATNRLVTSNATSNIVYNYTGGDRIMIASYNTTTEAESYLIRMNTFTAVGDPINKTEFEYYEGGNWVSKGQKGPGDTVTLGALTLTVNNVNITGGAKWVVLSGGTQSTFNTLYTSEGLKIDMPWVYDSSLHSTSSSLAGAIPINGSIYFQTTDAGGTGASAFGFNNTVQNATNTIGIAGHSWDSFNLSFSEEDKNRNLAAGGRFSMMLDSRSAPNNDLEVASFVTGRGSFTDRTNTDNIVSKVYSDLASEVWRLGSSSAQRSGKVIYNGGDSYGDIILTNVGANVSSSSTVSGNGAVKELGSVALTDAQAAQVSGKNLIVVGGSCVNKLASDLLSGAGCGTSWETATGVGAGQFLIQSFDRTGGKVATLVAGYSAQDTRNAAKVLVSDATVDLTAGKKYKSTSATSVQMVTTAA